MKFKSVSKPDQINNVLSMLFDGIKHEAEFENDGFRSLEFYEPNTNCRVRIAKPDNYGSSLSVMIEEPEGVTPNGYRLFGRYKKLVEVNEFFECNDSLIERLDGLEGQKTGTHYFNFPDELKEELNLEFHKTAVIKKDSVICPTNKPLLIAVENNEEINQFPF